MTGHNIPGMSEHRKPPSVGLCLALIAAVPVLYFLSIGPVVWIWSRTKPPTPEWLDATFSVYCMPAEFVYENAGPQIQAAMQCYVELFDGT